MGFMSEMIWFPKKPQLEPLGNGFHRLAHDYAYPVRGVWAYIEEGFLTDMASVPRWLTPFIQSDELGGSAPVVHDWLYQAGGVFNEIDTPLTRRQVDAMFRVLMRLEQVPAWRRGVAWLAVRLAGWACWRKLRRAT